MTMRTFQAATDRDGHHVFCWWCHPEQYPPMPSGFTLCARCGVPMTGDPTDPRNEALEVCPHCEGEILR